MVPKARNLRMKCDQNLSISELNDKLRAHKQMAQSYRNEIVRYALCNNALLVKQSARDLLVKHVEIAVTQLDLANAELSVFNDNDKI